MLNRLNLIIGAVLLIVFIGIAVYVKSLNDQVIKCKANTSIQKQKHKTDIERYEQDKKDIVAFYDGEIGKVNDFKKGSNETDCEASKRFLDNAPY